MKSLEELRRIQEKALKRVNIEKDREGTNKSQDDQKYVACNADEVDPGAFMDRSVLEGDPNSVVEAMAIAGYAIGSDQGYIYVRAEYPIAVHRLEIAIKQARELGLLGKNIFGTDFNFDLEIRLGAGAFVCGEETALLNSIEGKRGMPRPRPPFPAIKGLWQKPTLLNNVETYANIPQIILNGAEWFSAMGTEKSKGTKVFALGGKINNTGLIEIPMGTTLREVIYEIGGGIPDGKEFKAVLTGGPSGGCITKAHLDTPIDYDNLVALGSMMGSGGMIVMDEDNCMVDIATLCNDKRLIGHGACRICVCEVAGARSLVPACTAPVAEGMVIYTHSETVIKTRKEILELMIENHPLDCLTCTKTGSCKLQDYCYEYDITEGPFHGEKKKYPIDDTNEFYYADQNKCISCGKCVRVCNELQCTGAIGQYERGFETHVGAPFDIGLKDSICVSCGNCVAACPVGALMPKSKEKFRQFDVKKVRTTCAYCGVGCQMDLLVKNNKVVGVEPADVIPNDGLLCVKGRFAYKFIDHPDRLKTPLIRKNGVLVEATWDEAYDLITSKMISTKENFGANAIAGLSSARCTNEENYLFQKLFRAVIGTNNIDHCARLCHASTVAGLATTLGSGAMTNGIHETINSDVIFVIGSNTTETHPVIGAKIKQALLKGAKLIVAEPRKIELAKSADVFLQITPGTNVALLNGMMHVIIEEGLQAKEYIDERVEGYEGLEKILKDYTPEKVALICGVDPEDIKRAARLYANAPKASLFYAMGVTQHSTGTYGVMSTSNLALLCGNIGIESGGVNPLRGQNNVQGACDMG